MNFFISIYIIFWIILSERLSFESIIIGTVICSMVLYFNKEGKMKIFNRKVSYFEKAKLWTAYIFVLLREIVVSNFQVAKIVLSPQIKISPKIVTFKTNIKSDLNKTILANSITLTPGTLSIGLDENSLAVHCLDERYADGISNTDFEKIIMRVEG